MEESSVILTTSSPHAKLESSSPRILELQAGVLYIYIYIYDRTAASLIYNVDDGTSLEWQRTCSHHHDALDGGEDRDGGAVQDTDGGAVQHTAVRDGGAALRRWRMLGWRSTVADPAGARLPIMRGGWPEPGGVGGSWPRDTDPAGRSGSRDPEERGRDHGRTTGAAVPVVGRSRMDATRQEVRGRRGRLPQIGGKLGAMILLIGRRLHRVSQASPQGTKGGRRAWWIMRPCGAGRRGRPSAADRGWAR